MSLRSELWKISDFWITFILYYAVGVALHEYWHANVAKILGYSATANFHWFSGWINLSPYPINPFHIILIGIVGGGGVALFYMLIALFTEDWKTRMVLHIFAPLHGTYAICEVLYLFEYISIQTLAIVPIIVTITIMIIMNRKPIIELISGICKEITL